MTDVFLLQDYCFSATIIVEIKKGAVMKELHTHSHDYLKEATDEEKDIFITVLCTLASADGKINPEEMQYIDELAKDANIEIRPVFFSCPIDICIERTTQMQNRPLALVLLKHMFILAYTDNEFSDSEGNFICQISQALNIEPEKVQEISSWVIDRIIWLEQEEHIFEE